jgi:hypothetical protein
MSEGIATQGDEETGECSKKLKVEASEAIRTYTHAREKSR